MVPSAQLDISVCLKKVPLYHYRSKCKVFKRTAPRNCFYWNKPQRQLRCKLVSAPQVKLSTKTKLCEKKELLFNVQINGSNSSALRHFHHTYKCGPIGVQKIRWCRIENFVAATWRSWLVICLSHSRRKHSFLVILVPHETVIMCQIFARHGHIITHGK
jgi:hypothetical protein